jgi:hypothetical protein
VNDSEVVSFAEAMKNVLSIFQQDDISEFGSRDSGGDITEVVFGKVSEIVENL